MKIGFRVPTVIPGEPELSFCMLEQGFVAAGITTETTKFSHLSNNLDSRHAVLVKDLIMAPPATTPYTSTKRELLKRLNVSQESKTKQLLVEQVLGDRTPSQFLRHLQGLAVKGTPETMIRTLWISRLPVQVQAIIAILNDQPLTKIAEVADEVIRTFQGASPIAVPQIAAAETLQANAADRLSIQMAQLTLSLREEISEVRRAVINRADLRASVRCHADARDLEATRTRTTAGITEDSEPMPHAAGRHASFRETRRAGANSGRRPESKNARPIYHGQSQVKYLIDTGADLCVYPRASIRSPLKRSAYELAAANRTPIYTYGTIALSLNLGLRRALVWKFIIADMPRAIIGADLLAQYGFLVDLQGSQLIKRETHATSKEHLHSGSCLSVKVITGTSSYHQLLAKYPDISQPDGRVPVTRHNTSHFIETTPGPPVSCKARRLSPTRLSRARQKFGVMVKLGTTRRGKDSWAAPLHMAPKGEDDERPCGDYHGLNARTKPDRYQVPNVRDFAQRRSYPGFQ